MGQYCSVLAKIIAVLSPILRVLATYLKSVNFIEFYTQYIYVSLFVHSLYTACNAACSIIMMKCLLQYSLKAKSYYIQTQN